MSLDACAHCGAPARLLGAVALCSSAPCARLILTPDTARASLRLLREQRRWLYNVRLDDPAAVLGQVLFVADAPVRCEIVTKPLTNTWGELTGGSGYVLSVVTSDGPLLRGRGITLTELRASLEVSVRVEGNHTAAAAWVLVTDLHAMEALVDLGEVR